MPTTLLANALRFDPTRTATLQRRVRVLVGNEFAVSPSHGDCVRSRIGMYAPPTPSFLQEYGRVLACAYRAGYDRSLYDAHRPLLSRLGVNAVSDITDVTDTQRQAISDLLRSAAEKGQNPRKIATELARKTGLSKDRALLIAQTELIGAYAEGQLDALEQAGVSEVTAQVEWVTAGDSRVCPRCSAMEGVKLKISEARGKIPLHPRCRCAWVPAEGISLRDEPTAPAPSPETPTPPTAPTSTPEPLPTVAPVSPESIPVSVQPADYYEKEKQVQAHIESAVGKEGATAAEQLRRDWKQNLFGTKARGLENYISDSTQYDAKYDPNKAGPIHAVIGTMPRAELSDLEKQVVDEMIKQTQKELKDAGVKYVTIYRGASPADTPTPGQETDYKNRALSSWSTEPTEAAKYGPVLTARVPVDKVAFVYGGSDKEIVVIGDVKVVPYSSIPSTPTPAPTLTPATPSPSGEQAHGPSDNYTRAMPNDLAAKTKAVDPKTGQVLTFYTGSRRNFEGNLLPTTGDDNAEAALYVTESKATAANYTDEKTGQGEVVAVRIYTENPLDATRPITAKEAKRIAKVYAKYPTLAPKAPDVVKAADKKADGFTRYQAISGAPSSQAGIQEWAKYPAEQVRREFRQAMEELGYDSIKHEDYDAPEVQPDGSTRYPVNYAIFNPAQVYSGKPPGSSEFGKTVVPRDELPKAVTPTPAPKTTPTSRTPVALPTAADLKNVTVKYNDATVFGKPLPDESKAAIDKTLGTTDPKLIAGMTNAVDGAVTQVTYTPWDKKVSVLSKGDGVIAEREFTRKKGKLQVENVRIEILPDSPYKGQGVTLFARQVDSLSKAGIDEIVTTASGKKGDPEGYNGYYTWPRMGYDGPIPKKYLNKMPPELLAQATTADGKTSILALYSTPEGREWWKENGGELKLKFDLKEGSPSRQVLEEYLREREQRKQPSPPTPKPVPTGTGEGVKPTDRPVEPTGGAGTGTGGRSITAPGPDTGITEPPATSRQPDKPSDKAVETSKAPSTTPALPAPPKEEKGFFRKLFGGLFGGK